MYQISPFQPSTLEQHLLQTWSLDHFDHLKNLCREDGFTICFLFCNLGITISSKISSGSSLQLNLPVTTSRTDGAILNQSGPTDYVALGICNLVTLPPKEPPKELTKNLPNGITKEPPKVQPKDIPEKSSKEDANANNDVTPDPKPVQG